MHCFVVNPAQACLYKAGDAAQRAEQVKQIALQLDMLEGVVQGPYVVGDELTSGDGCLLGTAAWLDWILPRKFGWAGGAFAGRPKLAAWYAAMQADPAGARVVAELQGGLEKWDANGRWEELGISAQVADPSFKWAY